MECSNNGLGVVEVIKGSDHTIRVSLLTEEGTAFDLTDAAIVLAFPLQTGETGLITSDDEGATIEISSPEELGVFTATLPAEFTTTMKAGKRQTFECKATRASKVYKLQFKEMLDVVSSMT